MGAVIRCAALFLGLSVLSSTLSSLPAQTPAAPPPSEIATSAAPSLPSLDLISLPDSPEPAAAAIVAMPASSTPCPRNFARDSSSDPDGAEPAESRCIPTDTHSLFLNNTEPAPLTPLQKAHLAFADFRDPANLISIEYMAAFTIGTNAHTPYGPGWKGLGRNTGYRLVRDATGEFVGTFMIPSLTGQDPRYHRMPNASVPRRLLHAVSHTLIAQNDAGRPMPNFGILLGTPIRAEIANLYIPGVQDNVPDTARRVLISWAEDPIGDVITEFLPNVARHVHIHVGFAQRMLDEATGNR